MGSRPAPTATSGSPSGQQAARSAGSRPPARSPSSPIPTPSSSLDGITAGPDGNLWFTEAQSATDRADHTAGVDHRVPAPAQPAAGPSGIAAGPDGNLWFTEISRGNTIGRITTAGVVTEFSPGSRRRRPSGSRPGPTATSGSPSGRRARSAGSPRPASSPSSPGLTADSRALRRSRPVRTATSGSRSRRQDRADHHRRGRHRVHTSAIPSASPSGSPPGPTATSGSPKSAGKIGRITTAGVVTEFPHGVAVGRPRSGSPRPRRQPLVHRAGRHRTGRAEPAPRAVDPVRWSRPVQR